MLLAFGLGPEIIVFLVIVLLLFGNRLPGAMKSLGQDRKSTRLNSSH